MGTFSMAVKTAGGTGRSPVTRDELELFNFTNRNVTSIAATTKIETATAIGPR